VSLQSDRCLYRVTAFCKLLLNSDLRKYREISVFSEFLRHWHSLGYLTGTLFMPVALSETKIKSAVDLTQWKADLNVPPKALGLVIFSLNGEIGADDPRNHEIARAFQKNRLGTLIYNQDAGKKFRNGENISARSRQLAAVAEWAMAHEQSRGLPIGFFGSYGGTPVSLMAAAELGHRINTMVLCSGQLDLARAALNKVKPPTLLIVGGRDIPLIDVNERASKLLRCEKALTIVPRASRYFEEPGALSAVARISSEWFLKSLHGNRLF
jgi:putative phosphoribosyl transferase